MAREIERKFLIDRSRLPGCLKPTRISQGYLNSDKSRTVRVRIAGDTGWITVKGESTSDGLSRYEWEIQIPLEDATQLIGLCESVIDKTRYHMIHKGMLWEIDVFHGPLSGLVVAEIELESETQEFAYPDWIVKEVTGDVRFYNSNLSQITEYTIDSLVY